MRSVPCRRGCCKDWRKTRTKALTVSRLTDIIIFGRRSTVTVSELIDDKQITKYRLSKDSGIAYTTVNDLCSGRTQLEKCFAETVYRISKALGVSMENLIEPCLLK